MKPSDYLAKNRELWNQRTPVHVSSEFYDMPAFLSGASSLKDIELNLLGDVKNKSILHLQCHFGQDTLSLARMGAKVTGIDLSDVAIAKGRELNSQLGLDAQFICSDLYELPNHLTEQFDLVFTSYGTIGWLPDMDRWAAVVAGFLKPGGRFVFVEFHPVVWMFDNDFASVGYSYFNRGPLLETEQGTYADRNAALSIEYVGWNHSLSEVLSALLNQGLILESFEELEYSPFNCFSHTEEYEPGKYRIKHLDNKIPMVYALRARK